MAVARVRYQVLILIGRGRNCPNKQKPTSVRVVLCRFAIPFSNVGRDINLDVNVLLVTDTFATSCGSYEICSNYSLGPEFKPNSTPGVFCSLDI